MEQHKENADAILQRAIRTWGEQAQLNMVIEESAELMKEICKWQRKGLKDTPDALLDEFADVEIMLKQLEFMCAARTPDARARIDAIKQKKVARVAERLEAS